MINLSTAYDIFYYYFSSCNYFSIYSFWWIKIFRYFLSLYAAYSAV